MSDPISDEEVHNWINDLTANSTVEYTHIKYIKTYFLI